MNINQKIILEQVSETLDIPEKAFEKAESRYRHLGEWFGRQDAVCAAFRPRISSQGSFRLGTVVRADEYDLDFTCNLQEGINPRTHSQAEVKRLVRDDMAAYRQAFGIKEELESKHRCWRLQYADELSFHMDVVPAIPHDSVTRQRIEERMIKMGGDEARLAPHVARHACAITDDRRASFEKIDPDWLVSNPEGYAIWFESRVHLARAGLNDTRIGGTAEVDDLPNKRGSSPLQLCVKILKRHRDLMFIDRAESKPISIILTTLAGRAYTGEVDVAQAIENCLRSMELVRAADFQISNPVNPSENFADKWNDRAYSDLRLFDSFRDWVRQARVDFESLGQPQEPQVLAEVAGRFGGRLDSSRLRHQLGSAPVRRAPTYAISGPASPWSRGGR